MPLVHTVLSTTLAAPPPDERVEAWFAQASAIAETLDVAGGLIVDGQRVLWWLEGRMAAVQALLVSIEAVLPSGAAGISPWIRRAELRVPPAPRTQGWRRADVPPSVYDAVEVALSAGAAEGGLILLRVLLGDELPD